MPNTVQTDFFVNLGDSLRQVDAYQDKVKSLDKPSAALADSSEKATNKIAAGFDKAKVSVKSFGKTAADATPPGPTISRYWENESDKVAASVDKIKQAENSLGKRSGYRTVGFKIDDSTGEIVKPAAVRPPPNFKIDYGESEFNTAAKSIGAVGDEVEKVNTKLGRLRGYGAIFRELNLGLNETELNAGLAGAEIAGIGAATLATFGATAVAGVAIVKVTEQIKSEAEGRLHNEELITGAINKQIIGLRDAFAEYEKFKTSLINDKAFTNRLAADVGVYDTKALQAERGKAEANNKSSIVEINRLQSQLAQNERSLEFEKGRKVSQSLLSEIGIGNEYTASQKTQNISQATRAVEETRKSLADQEQALEKGKSALQQTDKALIDVRDKQNKNFNDNAENSIKSREDAAKYRESQAEKAKAALDKRNADIEKATKKVDELGKRYTDTFDNLFVSTSKGNPFASVFSESDRAVDKLRENLKGLKPELRAIAEQLQAKGDSLKLFETRLDNNLGTFELRERASELRNFQPKFDHSQADEIARRNVSYGGYTPGGTYGSDLASRAGGFDKLTEQQRRDIYQVSLLSQFPGGKKGIGDYSQNPFADPSLTLNNRSLISALASEQLRTQNPDENLAVQQRLDKQLDIIASQRAKTPQEQALADRKALSLSSGLRPEQLTDSERTKLASINEREAVRRDNYEREAQKLRAEQAGYLKEIRDYQQGLKGTAGQGGNNALTVTIQNQSDADASIKQQTRTPTAQDTADYYRIGDVHDAGKLYGARSVD